MKIISSSFRTDPRRYRGSSATVRGEGGSATIIYIVLMGIMMALVVSNVRTIVNLRATEKLIERKQIQRLNPGQTNNVAVAVKPMSKPETK